MASVRRANVYAIRFEVGPRGGVIDRDAALSRGSQRARGWAVNLSSAIRDVFQKPRFKARPPGILEWEISLPSRSYKPPIMEQDYFAGLIERLMVEPTREIAASLGMTTVRMAWQPIEGPAWQELTEPDETWQTGRVAGGKKKKSPSAVGTFRKAQSGSGSGHRGQSALVDVSAIDLALEEAARLSNDLDDLQVPIKARAIDLIAGLDAVRGAPVEKQKALVDRINNHLLRLDVHLACPTCGTASVLEHRNPRPSSRYAGGIVAAHVFSDDRSQHSPTSWRALSLKKGGTTPEVFVPRQTTMHQPQSEQV